MELGGELEKLVRTHGTKSDGNDSESESENENKLDASEAANKKEVKPTNAEKSPTTTKGILFKLK